MQTITVPTQMRTAFDNILLKDVSPVALKGGLAANVADALSTNIGMMKVNSWNAHLSFRTAKLLKEQGILVQ